MADVPVLAIHAAKGTAAEEYGARALLSADGWFLPQVGGNPGNDHFFRQSAKSVVNFIPLDVAAAGTKIASFHVSLPFKSIVPQAYGPFNPVHSAGKSMKKTVPCLKR